MIKLKSSPFFNERVNVFLFGLCSHRLVVTYLQIHSSLVSVNKLYYFLCLPWNHYNIGFALNRPNTVSSSFQVLPRDCSIKVCLCRPVWSDFLVRLLWWDSSACLYLIWSSGFCTLISIAKSLDGSVDSLESCIWCTW